MNMNVNTVLTALLSQEWETLLRRLVVFICMLAFTFIISLSLSLSQSWHCDNASSSGGHIHFRFLTKWMLVSDDGRTLHRTSGRFSKCHRKEHEEISETCFFLL